MFSYLFYMLSAWMAATAPASDHGSTPAHGGRLAKIIVQSDEQRWVDSVFNSLSPDQRIGQLFMIRAHSDKGLDHVAVVEQQIRDYNVGSLCFFQGTPEKQAEMTNYYQQLARVPLMIAIDGEWGLGMRMKEAAISFPKQLMLGAIQENKQIYDMGREVARQCRRVGIHINFAPDCDVNNNPRNPVINERSFGENRFNVATKSYMYMKGMQDGQVLACAKHFPGHGDTDVDSHKDLPTILHDRARLDSVELLPFRVLIQNDVQSIMVAHLHVPAIDSTPNLPTTLSEKAVTGLLKNQLNFKGLIFTDALEMKGVANYFPNGEMEVRALQAGNDILCLPNDIAVAFTAIRDAVASGRLSQASLDERVKKILRYKYQLGLNKYKPVNLDNIREDLNNNSALAIKKRLVENSLTLVHNDEKLLPISGLAAGQAATISIGAESKTAFQQMLDNYADLSHYNIAKHIPSDKAATLYALARNKKLLIVGIHGMNSRAASGFGVTDSAAAFVDSLQKLTKVLVVCFGNPYGLKHFDRAPSLMQAFNEEDQTQELAAQAVFGVFPISGRLPVTASENCRQNTGVSVASLDRIGYALPEQVGLNSAKLDRIDDIVRTAIDSGATPGAVVLVMKNGRIVFHKAYGYHTYEKAHQTDKNDVFDLASVTKVAATTLSVMKLYDEGIIKLEAPLASYLPELKGTNKGPLSLREVMAHHAGLTPWIPFYKATVTDSARNGFPLPAYYQTERKDNFQVPVTEKLFMLDAYVDTIWNKIIASPLRENKSYRYSDLGLMLAGRMVQQVSGKSLDRYADSIYYGPLGLRTTTFLPLRKTIQYTVVPTEEDNYFRQQRIQGYVHDMGAAMLGGVSGHAGLFSNARDLAILMQLMLNKGKYAGIQYLKPETVKLFTSRYAASTRRGIGFDMKELDNKAQQNMSKLASSETFGHLGFTGTCVWADPKYNLVYIFLSNRTYPNMNNNKLIQMDTRIKVQDAIYEALTDRP